MTTSTKFCPPAHVHSFMLNTGGSFHCLPSVRGAVRAIISGSGFLVSLQNPTPLGLSGRLRLTWAPFSRRVPKTWFGIPHVWAARQVCRAGFYVFPRALRSFHPRPTRTSGFHLLYSIKSPTRYGGGCCFLTGCVCQCCPDC